MEYIRMDKYVKDRIDSIIELDSGDKYLSMIFLNRILFSYNYLSKQKNIEDNEEIFVRKSIESITDGLFGKKEITYKCIRALEKYNLIKRGESYLKNEYSKGFQPLFSISNKFTTVRAKDYLSSHQITNLRKRIEKQRNKELEWHLENLKRDIEIDLFLLTIFIHKFFGYEIKSYTDRENYIEQVMNIEIKEEDIVRELEQEGVKITKKRIKKAIDKKCFYKQKILELLELERTEIVKGEKGGRHYHALSNTPTALKSCMVSRNKKKPYLLQVDIKNSQPFFLLCLIEKAKLEIEESMKIAILNGKFYERVGELWGFNSWDITDNKRVRKIVKEMVFRYLFFCKTKEDRLENDKFQKIKEKYPLFASAVEQVADVEGRTLASLLQEIETKEVLPVVKKFKAIGIHDAVVLIAVDKQEQVERVKEELLARFRKKYKMTPQVSIELLSERNEEMFKLFKSVCYKSEK